MPIFFEWEWCSPLFHLRKAQIPVLVWALRVWGEREGGGKLHLKIYPPILVNINYCWNFRNWNTEGCKGSFTIWIISHLSFFFFLLGYSVCSFLRLCQVSSDSSCEWKSEVMFSFSSSPWESNCLFLVIFLVFRICKIWIKWTLLAIT